MDYKNGYKVVYEVAADGERTFYAAKSNAYPTRDEAGNITDDVIATFVDKDFEGKTIYEYKGKFYVSAGRLPAYNEDGEPDVANGEVELDFSKVLEEATPEEENTPAPASIEEIEEETQIEDLDAGEDTTEPEEEE